MRHIHLILVGLFLMLLLPAQVLAADPRQGETAVLFGMGAFVWALVRTREMPIAPAM